MKDAHVNPAIVPLTVIECVRRRPGMYVEHVDARGLHCLAQWLLEDTLEWAQTPTRLIVTIEGDALTLEDDRRAILPEPAQMRDIAEQLVPLVPNPRGLYGRNQVTVANGLSREFVFELWIDGVGLRCEYAHGQLQAGPLPFTPASPHGCRIRLAPDDTIFASVAWDLAWLTDRLRTLAATHTTTRIELHVRYDGHTHEYVCPSTLESDT